MVSLKEFQRKCLEKERERESQEFDNLMIELIKEAEEKKILEEWIILREAGERLGKDYEPISVWGGLKKDKCPCCKEILNRSIVLVKELYDYQILYCSNCGYRFAEKKRNNKD